MGFCFITKYSDLIQILAPAISQVFSFILAMYVITDPIFGSGITAAGYHHVNDFDGPKRREHYDDFYGKALQVVDVNVLSFADHVQALLVDYICDILAQPRAAKWFCVVDWSARALDPRACRAWGEQ
jgi:hypothetical protein